MQLSKHFTLEELIKSSLALRLGIDNTPGPAEISCLKDVAENILEPVRERYAVSFTPNSGYRCLALNKALKSGDNSQHIKGQAVDIEIPGVTNLDLALWVFANLEFDQLILECYTPGEANSGWVHCSYIPTGGRKQVLTFSDGQYQEGLIT